MSIRSTTLSVAVAALSMAATAVIAANTAAPETPGSAVAEARAEATHLSKVHGIDYRARQPQAQASGSAKAEAVAEAAHLARMHGNVNATADQRLEFDHPNH